MARRKKENPAGILAMLYVYIPVIIAILSKGALIYGYLLVLPFLYYNFWGARKLDRNKALYAKAWDGLSRTQNCLDVFRRQNMDLHLTQAGRYDERSYRGKDANKERDHFLKTIRTHVLQLDVLLTPYKNAMAIRAAITVNFFLLIALSFSNIQLELAPIFAMCLSILTGCYWYASINKYRNSHPKIRCIPSIFFLAIWLYGSIFSYSVFLAPHRLTPIEVIRKSHSPLFMQEQLHSGYTTLSLFIAELKNETIPALLNDNGKAKSP